MSLGKLLGLKYRKPIFKYIPLDLEYFRFSNLEVGLQLDVAIVDQTGVWGGGGLGVERGREYKGRKGAVGSSRQFF